MRRIMLLALLLGAAAAHASGEIGGVSAPAPITGVAVDGSRVAYVTGRSRRECDRVSIWSLSLRTVTRLGRGTACVRTSTGTGIAAVAIAGTRVLWLHYTGGNIREWSLWTATTKAPRPRRLAFVTGDVDAAAPIVIGDGDANRYARLLPYAIGRTVVALSPSGVRRFSWTAPNRVAGLSTVAGTIAVAYEGGAVAILDQQGSVIGRHEFADEVDVVRLAFGTIVVQQGRTLELRGSGEPRTWTLPPRARLEDATATHAFYVDRGLVHALSFASGRDRVISAGAHVAVDGPMVAVAGGRRVRLIQLS